ncbi:Ribosomal protein L9, N-terminal domain [Paenibacillus tianmuensis]|uniref:Ribosomal protein L9, N-terminal domain n=1 Tax=Paenibacillus tianmuensis TaxID=624147 RepID=A0A1G4S9R1_9BACL|nr:hypothetical protein [Paenibacillus tianmuensis]SCW65806.1 Ribosomal protein L9, N-terminal domain [Paenibacillus tianmuensis]
MAKFIKVKMLKNNSHGKKGEIIVVEERYAQLYLFHRNKAVLIEESDKNKSEAGYPIPKHLNDILIPMGTDNNENRVDGVVRCLCGCETFSVSVYGDKEGQDIYVGEYNNDSALMIKAECTECHKTHLIFDLSKHGWNGFVCHDGVTVPDDELFPWPCKKCSSDVHHIKLTIISEGKEDYVDNLGDDIGDGKEFSEDDWVEAFGWITISLTCSHCGFNDERWIDYETM